MGYCDCPRLGQMVIPAAGTGLSPSVLYGLRIEVCYPKRYLQEGKQREDQNKYAPEDFFSLPFSCCNTKELRFITHLYVLYDRNQDAKAYFTAVSSTSTCGCSKQESEGNCYLLTRSLNPAKARYYQFSLVQSLSCVRIFATLWTATHQASLSITSSQSSLKLISIGLVMPSNHLILCRPLLLLPSQHQSLLRSQFFKSGGQSIGASASVSINLSSEYPGLISFRIDWFDLLLVQGSL